MLYRLYLVACCADISAVSTELASQCTMVLFTPECDGLESLLLDEFLEIQNMKTFNEQKELRQVSMPFVCYTIMLDNNNAIY